MIFDGRRKIVFHALPAFCLTHFVDVTVLSAQKADLKCKVYYLIIMSDFRYLQYVFKS